MFKPTQREDLAAILAAVQVAADALEPVAVHLMPGSVVRNAVRFDDLVLTYQELRTQARQIESVLRADGVTT